MALTQRHEQEMKQKCQDALRKTTDPVEQLRLKCLSRGAHGIKGIAKFESIFFYFFIFYKSSRFAPACHLFINLNVRREFRIMDDDRSNNLDYVEFKRGIAQFGLSFDEKVFKSIM